MKAIFAPLAHSHTAADVGAAPISHTSSGTTYGTANANVFGHARATTMMPWIAGTPSVGTDNGYYARGDHVHPAQTSVTGNAGTATKLSTARTVRTNLASTATASFDGSADVTPGVTGTLAVENGGTGATTAAEARENIGAAPLSHDHSSISGNAGTATKLSTARTVRTNLASTATASFDGSADVTPGVTGTLAVENGGTGATTAAAALKNLGVVYATSLPYTATSGMVYLIPV